MKTIIIDEYYDGVYKQGLYFKIDTDINFPICHVNIKIPLVSSKSIFSKSLKADKFLKVGKSLKVGEFIEVGGWLEVGESLKVSRFLKVGEWLKVSKFLEVGEWLSSYGIKSSMSINISCFTYFCQIWGGYIKIGCRLHTKEEWANFTDEEIEKMGSKKALIFWHKYKNFILASPNEKLIEEN